MSTQKQADEVARAQLLAMFGETPESIDALLREEKKETLEELSEVSNKNDPPPSADKSKISKLRG